MILWTHTKYNSLNKANKRGILYRKTEASSCFMFSNLISNIKNTKGNLSLFLFLFRDGHLPQLQIESPIINMHLTNCLFSSLLSKISQITIKLGTCIMSACLYIRKKLYANHWVRPKVNTSPQSQHKSLFTHRQTLTSKHHVRKKAEHQRVWGEDEHL